jgi:K+ transporter
VRHALPGVGENLRDHYVPRTRWLIDKKGITFNDRGRGFRLVHEAMRYALFRHGMLRGIDPERITFYSRRMMVVPCGKVPGMAVWRDRLFAAMHLNPNLPAAYFGVPTAQVVEVGLEVEI